MDIAFSPALGRARGPDGGALVIAVAPSGRLGPAAAGVDAGSGGAVKRALAKAHFRGEPGKLIEVLAPAGIAASRILIAGLGRPDLFDAGAAERLGAGAVARLLTGGEKTLTFAVDRPQGAKLSEADLAAHLAFGAYLRSYRFDRYRTDLKGDQPSLERVRVATRARAGAERRWTALAALGDGIFLARDLVNEPANVLYPEEMARRIRALGKHGLKVDVLTEAQMKKLGMNMLLAVGEGSAHESRLVVMHWNGGGKRGAKHPPVAFVGKGVCFDSGGLSLKPPKGMISMKGDMGGAAAVIGAMLALAKRKARVNAVGVVGLVENMPGGKAMRPNDIVKTMSGQTVEVLNTDAEGRLVLADALWYTQSKFAPRFMIDLATLTGAIVMTLGTEYAGLFANDDGLAGRIAEAGGKEGEAVWRLPMGKAYDRQLKSKIADMKNIGGPNAGSITAAQFLRRFVGKAHWAHLDIAGVAWQDSEQKPLVPSWGTGWGVRLLNRLIADHYER